MKKLMSQSLQKGGDVPQELETMSWRIMFGKKYIRRHAEPIFTGPKFRMAADQIDPVNYFYLFFTDAV